MNTSFEKSKNSTDEWYTPKEIIDALGKFDLDPCAPMRPLWRTARVMYNKEQDGLKQKWEGRVWLNPPYSRPTIEHFITRMVEHNNGIALLFNRLDNKMFQDVVFPKAKGILFMKGRIKFHREDGTIGESPGCGSILVAFGEENAETLRSSNQLGFWNVREYVLARDGHKCQHCKGKSKDPVLNVHHLESRKTGGDSPSNLITLCETCHKEYHKGNIDLKIKRGSSLRDAAVMGIMKWRLYEELKSKYDNISMTFGYVTKYNRIYNNIEKSHVSDAFIISKNFNSIRLGYYYKVRLVRRHNRQIHKQKIPKGGIKRPNQSPFEVFGFRLFDRVMFENSYYFIFARRKTGSFNIRDIDGKNQRDITYKKLKLSRCKRFMVQKEMD